MRRTLHLVLTGFVAMTLAGCAVSVVDPTPSAVDVGDEPPASAATSAPTLSETPARAGSTPAPDGGSTADAGAAARARILELATTTVRCDGELVLDQDGGVVVVDGPCERLVISLDAGAVLAGDVGTLEVIGAGSIIMVDGLSAVQITGDANEVHWIGPTPDVTDNGFGNVATPG